MGKVLYILMILLLGSIHNNGKDKFPPEGTSVAEFIEYQNSVDNHIKLLDSAKWDNRKVAKIKLLNLINQNKYVFDYFLKVTLQHKNPEVKLSSKEILQDYFKKNIYDPDRKKGFVGLQLNQGMQLQLGKQRYMPIEVVLPIMGFPGQKAGIREEDMILEVNEIKCSEKFNLNNFIAYIAAKKPGEEVNLKLFSEGKVISKKVILAARPERHDDSMPTKSKEELFEEWYSYYSIKYNNGE